MFIDASALVAILLREAGHADLEQRLHDASVRLTSGIAIFEAVQAIARETRLPLQDVQRLLNAFMSEAGIEVVPIAGEETRSALDACQRFGKGRGHPARLNLGDCFAYACATTRGVPLLFVGNDFVHTDVARGLA
ncbi:type II toxin-antitoxin system VapC family toxin [Methylobacterium oryzisoli]|jgi:ribonuclease VapC|uniref:type II toxin-antitoxin system VapC family toxin n=1 Tax=Methylobacterium oryzisoli TaxID=3385502 RepID=UPI0038926095